MDISFAFVAVLVMAAYVIALFIREPKEIKVIEGNFKIIIVVGLFKIIGCNCFFYLIKSFILLVIDLSKNCYLL